MDNQPRPVTHRRVDQEHEHETGYGQGEDQVRRQLQQVREHNHLEREQDRLARREGVGQEAVMVTPPRQPRTGRGNDSIGHGRHQQGVVVSTMIANSDDRDEHRGGYDQPEVGRQSILIALGSSQNC